MDEFIKIEKANFPIAMHIEAFGNPTLSLTSEFLKQLFSEIEANKSGIISSSAAIEGAIELQIRIYFMGRSGKNEIWKDFQSQILSSSWCSFDSKRKLYKFILSKTTTLKKGEVEDIDKKIRKVISYRNANVHGSFSTDGRMILLRYYEGELKEVNINSEYFENASEKIWDCLNSILSLGEVINTYVDERDKK